MPSLNSKQIYFFDFDGTITKQDSLFHFLQFALSTSKKIELLLKFLPTYIAQKVQLIPKDVAKEKLFKIAFKGIDENKFNELCENFANNKIPKLVYPSFLDFIEKIDSDTPKIVVSASIKKYLSPWCKQNGFKLICTELHFKNGKFTGSFKTPNCSGKEKVIRINSQFDLSQYDEIHVFGNSKGDDEMLELATHPYYQYFNK